MCVCVCLFVYVAFPRKKCLIRGETSSRAWQRPSVRPPSPSAAGLGRRLEPQRHRHLLVAEHLRARRADVHRHADLWNRTNGGVMSGGASPKNTERNNICRICAKFTGFARNLPNLLAIKGPRGCSPLRLPKLHKLGRIYAKFAEFVTAPFVTVPFVPI